MKKKALRRFPMGAEIVKDGVDFRVWAPRCKKVEVVTVKNKKRFPLEREKEGYFSATLDLKKGTLYQFCLDDQPNLHPDPASRFQPEGPHGPSCVIDPHDFKWTDAKWKGVERWGQVIYELHVGTFTEKGTWKAATQKLAYLAELGVTVIEMMPVADFPGRFNWGYDGVNFFAPAHQYGTPNDLKAFINEAHRHHLGVILDVVYNHFGPEGNYLTEFSWEYFKREKTEWGDSINFDSAQSKNVRAFFIANACYWIEEFHFDGFRFDACHALVDHSNPHIISEIVREARKSAKKRKVYITGENEKQNSQFVVPQEEGGFGLDAIWNEDFHHAAMVKLTGHNEAYYSDYLGKAQEFVSTAKYGFLYQGQWYEWQRQKRGSPALNLEPSHFINFLQNHDQVSNSPGSLRPNYFCGPALYRALTALFLLMPQTPLLFQGQEFGATTPFHYFCEMSKELADKVYKGRIEFVSQFKMMTKDVSFCAVFPPHELETFLTSKLNWQEKKTHQGCLQFHKDLLTMRKKDPVFKDLNVRLDGAILEREVFLIRYFSSFGERLLIINLGGDFFLNPLSEPLLAPPAHSVWIPLWNSERREYGGFGDLTPTLENRRMTGPAASLFGAKIEEFEDITLYPFRGR